MAQTSIHKNKMLLVLHHGPVSPHKNDSMLTEKQKSQKGNSPSEKIHFVQKHPSRWVQESQEKQSLPRFLPIGERIKKKPGSNGGWHRLRLKLKTGT